MKLIPCEPGQGYPAGREYVYRCKKCGALVESYPTHQEPWSCTCGNIHLDADGGRCSIGDHAQFEILEREP